MSPVADLATTNATKDEPHAEVDEDDAEDDAADVAPGNNGKPHHREHRRSILLTVCAAQKS